MGNHPNRGRAAGAARNPKPAEIIEARKAAGLTQTEAANMVHASLRNWQQWEAQEGTESHRRMHPGLWELFHIKLKARQQ